jgi:hypothetical protein
MYWYEGVVSVCIRNICIVFVLIVSGCATFHSEEFVIEKYAELPDDCDMKPTLSYNVLTDTEGELSNNLERVFTDSGVFESVSENAREADIRVNISFWSTYDRTVDRDKFFQEELKLFVSFISLFIIPTFSDMGVDSKVEIIKDGKSSKFDYHDEVTFIRWMPMLFFAPFNTSHQKAMDVSTSTYVKIVNKIINEEGWACRIKGDGGIK